MSSKSDQIKRLKGFYDLTIQTGTKLEDDIEDINYYSAFCKAAVDGKLFKMLDCNFAIFRYSINDKNGVLIIHAIPSQSNNETKDASTHSSQKIMDLLKIIEETFIKIDYMSCKDIKEDKFIYLTSFISSDRNLEEF